MVDLITRLQVCAKWDPDQAEAIEVIQAQAARIAELEAALQDMSKHVWRGDWDKIKPETRALLRETK